MLVYEWSSSSLSLNSDQLIRPLCYQVTVLIMGEHYLFSFEELFFLVVLYVFVQNIFA